jgi:uncharacterized protein (TIGR02145 family)
MRKILLILLIGGIGVLTNCGGDDGDLPCLKCSDMGGGRGGNGMPQISCWTSLYVCFYATESECSNYYGGIARNSCNHYDNPFWQGPSANSSSSHDSEGNSSSSPSVNYTDKGNSISSYETIPINGQVWMAENLNYKVAGSLCYGEGNSSYSASEVQANCDKYGRLYDWATAMNLPQSCNSQLVTNCGGQVNAKHQGICPSGWHIPSNEDWDKLMRYVDGSTGTSSPYDSPTAGRYLKATSGWYSCGPSGSGNSYLCEDTFGFSALPGGYGYSGGDFGYVGSYGYWWSSSEYNSNYAYSRFMDCDGEYAYYGNNDKSDLYSVRCVQD